MRLFVGMISALERCLQLSVAAEPSGARRKDTKSKESIDMPSDTQAAATCCREEPLLDDPARVEVEMVTVQEEHAIYQKMS